MSLEQNAKALLTAYSYGLIGEDAVREWADQVFIAEEHPERLPDWMFKLWEFGPDRCAGMPSEEFSFCWSKGSIQEEFLIELSKVDLADRADVERFARLAAGISMGEDLDDPDVQFGFQMYHWLNECGECRTGDCPECRAWAKRAVDFALDYLPGRMAAAKIARRRVLQAAGFSETDAA